MLSSAAMVDYILSVISAIMTLIIYVIIYMKRKKYHISLEYVTYISNGLFLYLTGKILYIIALFLNFFDPLSSYTEILRFLSEVIIFISILFLWFGFYRFVEIYTVGIKAKKKEKTKHRKLSPTEEDLYHLISDMLTQLCQNIQNLISPTALNNLVVKHIDMVGLKKDVYFDISGNFQLNKIMPRITSEPPSKRADTAIMICNYFLNEIHIFLSNLVEDRAIEIIEKTIRSVFEENEELVNQYSLDTHILHGFFSQFVSSGINELDQLIGGFPRGTIALIEGAPETDKDLFGYQFLYKNLENEHDGIFVTTKPAENLKKVSRYLGWDFKKYMEMGRFVIIDAYTTQIKKINDYAEFQSQGVILAKPTKEGFDIGLQIATEGNQSWITKCLYSDFLNTTLMKSDIYNIYPFLNEYFGFLRKNNFVAVFSIDDTMFDKKSLASIEELADICIELRSDDRVALKLKKLPSIIKHRNWIDYYIDDTGIHLRLET